MMDIILFFLTEKGFQKWTMFAPLVDDPHDTFLSMDRIECRHAALRRAILTKSAAWASDFISSSSDWIMMRQRKIEEMTHRFQRYALGRQHPDTATAECKEDFA